MFAHFYRFLTQNPRRRLLDSEVNSVVSGPRPQTGAKWSKTVNKRPTTANRGPKPETTVPPPLHFHLNHCTLERCVLVWTAQPPHHSTDIATAINRQLINAMRFAENHCALSITSTNTPHSAQETRLNEQFSNIAVHHIHSSTRVSICPRSAVCISSQLVSLRAD